MSAESVTTLTQDDPERIGWLTRMIYMSRPGPMDQAAYDLAAADAAQIIASGICPDPANHRLHTYYLCERCLACGGHEPQARAAGDGNSLVLLGKGER